MHTFKEYILNETSNSDNDIKFPTIPYIDISTGIFTSETEDWGFHDYEHENFEQWVTEYLHKNVTSHEVHAYFNADGELLITIDLANKNANFKSSFIRNICKSVLKHADDLLHTKLENKSDDAIYLTFRKELGPNIITDWPYIQFFLAHSNPVSFQDIHKKIPNCKTLLLYSSLDKIKSNVLGLLRIKTLNHIIVWPNKTNQWFSILQKYMNSNDILKCQIELIENDLEEYAQL